MPKLNHAILPAPDDSAATVYIITINLYTYNYWPSHVSSKRL